MSQQEEVLTQSKFAEMCGVTRQSIQKAIKKKYVITVKRGRFNMIHFNHEVTQAYLIKKQAETGTWSKPAHQDQKQPKTRKTAKKPGKNQQKAAEKVSPEDSLQELQRKKVLQEIRKIQADASLKELKVEEQKGLLIEKETLGAIVFQYLDALNMNMLEYPEMVIDTLIDNVKSGKSRGDISLDLRKGIESMIKKTKAQIIDRIE